MLVMRRVVLGPGGRPRAARGERRGPGERAAIVGAVMAGVGGAVAAVTTAVLLIFR
jgi:hypothetical protein